ncbi:MAG: MotA/TolQ/ExbB proton channel family protein [Akkermansia sp.]
MNFLLLAQAGSSVLEFNAGKKSYSMTELFNMGGFIMWFILVLSVAAVVVFIFCLFSTSKKKVLPDKFVEESELALRKRDYHDLERICARNDSCFAKIWQATTEFLLRNPQATIEEVREVSAAEGGRQAGILTRNIAWLSDIGAVAPMLGLLGTVIGMMRTFFEIANGNFEGVKQMQMAGGVAEALITTAGGLLLGIPAMLAYVYFRSRVHKRIGDMEAAVTHHLTVVAIQLNHQKRFGASSRMGVTTESLPELDNDPVSRREVTGL